MLFHFRFIHDCSVWHEKANLNRKRVWKIVSFIAKIHIAHFIKMANSTNHKGEKQKYSIDIPTDMTSFREIEGIEEEEWAHSPKHLRNKLMTKEERIEDDDKVNFHRHLQRNMLIDQKEQHRNQVKQQRIRVRQVALRKKQHRLEREETIKRIAHENKIQSKNDIIATVMIQQERIKNQAKRHQQQRKDQSLKSKLKHQLHQKKAECKQKRVKANHIESAHELNWQKKQLQRDPDFLQLVYHIQTIPT